MKLNIKSLVILIICFSLVFGSIVSAAQKEKVVKTKNKDITEIDIKKIDNNGNKGNNISIMDLPIDVASIISLETINGALTIKKILQYYPQANATISGDSQTIMQKKDNGNPKLEIYYGYQKSETEPWSQYYRVDGDKVIKADFATHRVWIEPVNNTKVNEIVANNLQYTEIPEWESL